MNQPIKKEKQFVLPIKQLPSPDLVVRVIRQKITESTYKYVFDLRSSIPALSEVFLEDGGSFETEELMNAPQDFFESRLDEIQRIYRDFRAPKNETNVDLEAEQDFFTQIGNIGTGLYDELFPEGLKQLYWSHLRKYVDTLLIITDDFWIPWELIKPYKNWDEEDDFLCETFSLSRWLTSEKARFPAKQEFLSLDKTNIIAAKRPSSAEIEANEIVDLLGSKAKLIAPNVRKVRELFSKDNFTVLHFACHGSFNKHNPQDSRLYLRSLSTIKESLCPRDIKGIFEPERPLVFLNTCHSARGAEGLRSLTGWAKTFLEKANSICFIGSNWEAVDDSARRFAINFYRNVLEGQPVASAAKNARKTIRASGDPTWLSYSVYGHPLARIEMPDDSSIAS